MIRNRTSGLWGASSTSYARSNRLSTKLRRMLNSVYLLGGELNIVSFFLVYVSLQKWTYTPVT
jgi:hypothetical protein